MRKIPLLTTFTLTPPHSSPSLLPHPENDPRGFVRAEGGDGFVDLIKRERVRNEAVEAHLSLTNEADEACGRIILFLDSDLQVSPDLLEIHLNAYALIPHLAAAGGSVLPVGEPGLFTWQLADHLSSWFNVHPKIKYSRPPGYLPSLNFSIDRASVWINRHLRWTSDLTHTCSPSR